MQAYRVERNRDREDEERRFIRSLDRIHYALIGAGVALILLSLGYAAGRFM
jgi:multisubunit Na+/H+ antiporter MnhB subunit